MALIDTKMIPFWLIRIIQDILNNEFSKDFLVEISCKF